MLAKQLFQVALPIGFIQPMPHSKRTLLVRFQENSDSTNSCQKIVVGSPSIEKKLKLDRVKI